MWAKTTMGVEAARPLRSSSSHSSCSWPRLPSPPALRSTTLTRPMKCTPSASKLYQPAPLVPRPYRVAVKLHVFVENVMLARHVMHVEPRLRDDAVGVVEFGEMGDIAGVNDEGWLDRKRI